MIKKALSILENSPKGAIDLNIDPRVYPAITSESGSLHYHLYTPMSQKELIVDLLMDIQCGVWDVLYGKRKEPVETENVPVGVHSLLDTSASRLAKKPIQNLRLADPVDLLGDERSDYEELASDILTYTQQIYGVVLVPDQVRDHMRVRLRLVIDPFLYHTEQSKATLGATWYEEYFSRVGNNSEYLRSVISHLKNADVSEKEEFLQFMLQYLPVSHFFFFSAESLLEESMIFTFLEDEAFQKSWEWPDRLFTSLLRRLNGTVPSLYTLLLFMRVAGNYASIFFAEKILKHTESAEVRNELISQYLFTLGDMPEKEELPEYIRLLDDMHVYSNHETLVTHFYDYWLSVVTLASHTSDPQIHAQILNLLESTPLYMVKEYEEKLVVSPQQMLQRRFVDLAIVVQDEVLLKRICDVLLHVGDKHMLMRLWKEVSHLPLLQRQRIVHFVLLEGTPHELATLLEWPHDPDIQYLIARSYKERELWKSRYGETIFDRLSEEELALFDLGSLEPRTDDVSLSKTSH